MGVGAAPGQADDVVDLDLAAGAHAKTAKNTGVHIDRDGRMAGVRRRPRPRRETAAVDALGGGLRGQRRVRVVGGFRLVAHQQVKDQAPGRARGFGLGMHHHAVARAPDTGSRQRPLTLDFHHAGATIAIGPVAVGGPIAEMGDFGAVALGHLP